MPHPDIDTALNWRGRTVVDRDGEKIGKFDELYLDSDDRPAWAAVTTGLFGMRQTFVPLAAAEPDGDRLQVPFDGEQVKAAPNVDPEERLTPEQEDELYRHYGLADVDGPSGEARPDAATAQPAEEDAQAATSRPLEPDAGASAEGGRVATPAGREPAAPAADADADAAGAPAEGGSDTAMTRSEEELVVGTRRRVRGRARLKKYVVTEHVQRTIPVQREEVRVEYEPADAGESPPDGDAPPERGPDPRERG